MDISDPSASRIVTEESFHSFDTDHIPEVSPNYCDVSFHREGEGLG